MDQAVAGVFRVVVPRTPWEAASGSGPRPASAGGSVWGQGNVVGAAAVVLSLGRGAGGYSRGAGAGVGAGGRAVGGSSAGLPQGSRRSGMGRRQQLPGCPGLGGTGVALELAACCLAPVPSTSWCVRQ